MIRQLSIQTGIDVVFLGAGGVEPKTTASSPAVARRQNSQPQPSTSADTVTLRRTDATLETVLSALFLGSSYTYRWVETALDEKPMLVIGTDQDAPFVEEELIALNYLEVAKVMELLPSSLNVKVTPLPDRSALLVAGTTEEIEVFRGISERLMSPNRRR